MVSVFQGEHSALQGKQRTRQHQLHQLTGAHSAGIFMATGMEMLSALHTGVALPWEDYGMASGWDVDGVVMGWQGWETMALIWVGRRMTLICVGREDNGVAMPWEDYGVVSGPGYNSGRRLDLLRLPGQKSLHCLAPAFPMTPPDDAQHCTLT